MANKDESGLSWPPTLPLEWSDYGWRGVINLSSWAGFQAAEPEWSASTSTPADGTADLHVDTPDGLKTSPSIEQHRAVHHLLEHQSEVAVNVRQAIIEKYPDEREAVLEAFEEGEIVLPEIQHPDELKTLITLVCVHVLHEALRGVAYIGFQFRCVWDDEHGFGVMTHLNRVVETGGADVSFLGWIAERDAETQQHN